MNSRSQTSISSRFEVLDWLRGLSALSVVVYHAVMPWGPHVDRLPDAEAAASAQEWLLYICHCGHLGVPIFFMISGYCISAAADKHRAAQHSLARYAWRRFYRIYPSYWIALAFLGLLAIVGLCDAVQRGLTPTQWIGNLILIEEWRPWLMPPPEKRYFLPVAWTLCYEEQFYFLVGVLLWLCPRWLFQCLAALTAFVVLNTYNLNIGPLRQFGDLNRYHTDLSGLVCDSRWLLFASGIGVYVFVTQATAAGWRRRLRWCIPVLLALLTLWELRQGDWYTNRFQTRVLTFSAALLLCGAQQHDRRLTTLRGAAPLHWLGQRTYSIYLIHFPPVMGVAGIDSALGIRSPAFTLCCTVPLALIAAILSGALFYHFVERRFVEGLLRSKGPEADVHAAP